MSLAERLEEYTVQDIYALPDGERAELIDGEIYMMAPPNRKHQRLTGSIYRKIADYIEDRQGNCEVNIAPFAVFLHADDKTYVEPDISVVCDKDKLDEYGCNGAPDWIVEIVSPSTRKRDYVLKLFQYKTAGVREYWIVDAEKERIMVYNFEQDTLDEYDFTNLVKAGIYEDLEIDFSKLDI